MTVSKAKHYKKERMYVVKRSGDHEPMYFDKITQRNEQFCEDLDVDPVEVSQTVIKSIKNGMKTEEIDILSAETALYMSTQNPEYEVLAKRIIISNLQKKTQRNFTKVTQKLNSLKLLDPKYYEFVMENSEELDDIPVYERDNDFSFFGFKTLEKSYLNKDVDDSIIERPQHMWLRVAIFLRMPDMDGIRKVYEMLSTRQFIHGSPTLFNSGCKAPQLSSCYLMGTIDDLDDMYDSLRQAAKISKFAGGIGVNLSMIRSKNSRIYSNGGKSTGLVPYMKGWDWTAGYVNQCFTPDTIVYTTKGPKCIDEVCPLKDKVITIDGSFKNVLKVFKNKAQKDILCVRTETSFEPIEVTKEHHIYAIQNETDTPYNDVMNGLDNGKLSPKFIEAKHLKPGDFVCIPVSTDVQDCEYTEDDFRFYGMLYHWIHQYKDSDGPFFTLCFTQTSPSMHAGIPGPNPIKSANFAISYLKDRNIKHDINRSETLNCTWIVIKRSDLCRTGFLGYSDEKEFMRDNHRLQIKSEFLNLPLNKSKAFIRGFLESDSFNSKRNGEFSTIYTVSRSLAYQLSYILSRVGILPTCNFSTEKDKIVYYVNFNRCDRVNEILGYDVKSSSIPDKLWYRVTRIDTKNYEGYVYDLNIEDNHNYTVGGLGLVHNSGKRKGAIAVYVEPHHADIFDVLRTRRNNTVPDMQCQNLHIGLWIPDLFMKRVREDGMWSLFDPNKVKGLMDIYGEEYERVYEQAEKDKKYESQIKARDLMAEIIMTQMETGEPYMLYKDHVNRKNNQSNIGIIKGSNLCSEITLYSDKDTTAVCNLASMSLPAFVRSDIIRKWGIITKSNCKWCKEAVTLLERSDEVIEFCQPYYDNLGEIEKLVPEIHKTYPKIFCFQSSDNFKTPEFIGGYTELANRLKSDPVSTRKRYDYESLGKAVEEVCENMNSVIDRNLYPTEESKKSNMETRPIGIGAQGFADVLQMMDLAWDDDETTELNKNIYATIYYFSLKKSVELSRVYGPYPLYKGSPMEKGLLQYDMWDTEPVTIDGLLQWDVLKSDIQKYGLRNSTVTTSMPTASTSQILGNNESFEPYTSNMYSRNVLSGSFPVINKHLVSKMKSMGLWTEENIENIIRNNGSIQDIEGLPDRLKEIYKTSWELKMRRMIDLSADRGPYTCMTQSLNQFMDPVTVPKLSSLHMYTWEKGLKTGMYYLRTRAKDPVKFTLMKNEKQNQTKQQPKTDTTPEECVSCGG